MERNEPTTGEIVRALRCDGDANNCVNCRYATYDTATVLCDQEQNGRDAADRLERLERENAALKFSNEEAVKLINKRASIITELTARAEKAEAERDAAIAEIKESYAFSTREDGEPIYDFALCLICSKKGKPECDCTSSVGSEFVWRGLRGKENA